MLKEGVASYLGVECGDDELRWVVLIMCLAGQHARNSCPASNLVLRSLE